MRRNFTETEYINEYLFKDISIKIFLFATNPLVVSMDHPQKECTWEGG